MARNSTAIHRQRRYLDRRPLPPEQPAGFGFRQIPVADLSDGQSISLTLPVVRRVHAFCYLAELDPGFVSRLFDGHHAEPTKHHSTLSPLGVAILKHERLGPGAFEDRKSTRLNSSH